MIETRATPVAGDRAPTDRRPGWAFRHPLLLITGVTLAVSLPLLVAIAVLRDAEWFPVLDLAMTEFRVRDVFGADTPLIGLPGRIGEYPFQGSHPGPLSFYLLAPTYRLLGSSSWALEAATVVIHVAAIATALWIGARRLGWRGVVVVAALLTLVVRGFGQVVLTQPWNPYLPVLAWLVVLLAGWSVLCGDHRMIVPLVVAASFCAQTHVPYLPLGVGMVALAIVWLVVLARRSAHDARRSVTRSLLWGVGVGAVLWLPPIANQLTNRPGNIRQLVDHFGSPPEAAIGFGAAMRIVLRHLDVVGSLGKQVVATETFADTLSMWRGALTLVLWMVAVGVSWRIGSRPLRALHVTVGVALLLATVSTARIFGRPWFYLTLSMWVVSTLMAGAILWTAITASRRRLPALPARFGATIAAGAVAVMGSLASTVAFASADHPEERLSEAVGALSGPTYEAVVAGVGAATGEDGRYVVRWSDAADIGSPGFGLLDELERRGLDVAADDYFRVPVTDQRTRRRADADAQIHLATGGYVDIWRAEPDAIEVATYDPRSAQQLREYDEVRTRFIERLEDEGLPELVELVDTNLFGMSVDVRLSAADHSDLGRLIELGQPMVVFIAPPPSDDDPTAL